MLLRAAALADGGLRMHGATLLPAWGCFLVTKLRTSALDTVARQ
jgi:hypothetical protein